MTSDDTNPLADGDQSFGHVGDEDQSSIVIAAGERREMSVTTAMYWKIAGAAVYRLVLVLGLAGTMEAGVVLTTAIHDLVSGPDPRRVQIVRTPDGHMSRELANAILRRVGSEEDIEAITASTSDHAGASATVRLASLYDRFVRRSEDFGFRDREADYGFRLATAPFIDPSLAGDYPGRKRALAAAIASGRRATDGGNPRR